MKNKKGDIPITVLVIGVFVVCTLAILSFFHSTSLIRNSFVGIDVLEKANIEIEKDNLEEYHDDYNITVISPEFGFDWLKEKTIFEVQYNSNP